MRPLPARSQWQAPKVVLAVRDTAKGERIAATITGDKEVRPLDLEDLASIRAFAAAWTGPIDILVNNAGIMQVPLARTADGFERQIGTNHLGHFALGDLSRPHITDRIIRDGFRPTPTPVVGSISATCCGRDRPIGPTRPTADSKLANLVFTFELQPRLSTTGSSVRAIAVHPGMVRTGLFDHATGPQAALINFVGRFLLVDPEQGAQTTLFAATADVPGGSFVAPGGIGHLRGAPEIASAARVAYDPALGRDLWALPARLTATQRRARPIGGATKG